MQICKRKLDTSAGLLGGFATAQQQTAGAQALWKRYQIEGIRVSAGHQQALQVSLEGGATDRLGESLL
ncbi:MAG TPA: hypothetical protein VFU47_14455, partial [Armatimonadota bacterium]|nr:hypothetical protein [Armatimonadota bacterium]